jgi:DNA polymerase-3 subunit epsilon
MKLLIFDIETTGLDRKIEQIIQFSGIIIDTENNKIISELNEYIQPMGNYTIGYAAYFKHGISPEFLKDKPFFKDVAPKIISFLNSSDGILTYNGLNFDIPFLLVELNKYGFTFDFSKKPIYDAFLEEKRRNGNTLEETYKRYKGKSMEESGLKAHDALSDVKATYSVFYAQQKNKQYAPEHIYGEDNVITDQEFRGEIKPCFNIGKYKALSVEFISQIDQQYLNWAISDKCTFMDSTKNFIKNYIK